MLLPLAALLNGLGYVFIVRLDEAQPEPEGLAGLQAVWMILGVAAFVATLMVVRDVRKLERYRYTAGFVGLVLLLLPLLPVVGRTINGSRIWVSFGPVNFQPGEFAKLALAVFFAGYLVEKRELLAINRPFGPLALPDPKHLGPVLIAWGVALVVMVLREGPRLVAAVLHPVPGAASGWRPSGPSYLVVGVAAVRRRRRTWPSTRSATCRSGSTSGSTRGASDEGYQVVQAAFAMADGGVAGRGLGLGVPRQDPGGRERHHLRRHRRGAGPAGRHRGARRVPAHDRRRPAHRPAGRADGFERLLATGLTTLLGFQAFIIMAGVIRLLPLTGVTLPFVSYGGSSLLANYVLLALLLRISDDTRQPRGRARRRRASVDARSGR